MITPKTTKQGKRVFVGPTSEVLPGERVLVNWPTGPKWELIGKVGKPFMAGDVEMVYGYLPTKEDFYEISKRQSRQAWNSQYATDEETSR